MSSWLVRTHDLCLLNMPFRCSARMCTRCGVNAGHTHGGLSCFPPLVKTFFPWLPAQVTDHVLSMVRACTVATCACSCCQLRMHAMCVTAQHHLHVRVLRVGVIRMCSCPFQALVPSVCLSTLSA